MNVLSLFDGMSCGQIALERAGIKVDNYLASEIDKYAMKVTKANYPNTKHIGSVVDINSNDLPDIDLLIGGSPCQGFSFAGKQLNFDDPRSALFFEFVRLLKETEPKYFLLENVRMKKEYQDVISYYLDIEPICINSSLVSAQNRVRYYWTNIPNIKQPEDKNIFAKDIQEIHDGKCSSIRMVKKERFVYQMKIDKMPTMTTYCGNPNGFGRPFWSNDNFKCDKPFDYSKVRRLTINEAERLQTVPDNYTDHVSNAQRYKMLGNGWTVDVISHIFSYMDL